MSSSDSVSDEPVHLEDPSFSDIGDDVGVTARPNSTPNAARAASIAQFNTYTEKPNRLLSE